MKFGSIVAQAITLLIRCASGTSSTSEVEWPSPVEVFPDVECPLDCQDIFGNLEDGLDGNKTRSVRLQLRGEPKSGTGMTMGWSWGALAHVGLYLQRLYGRESCQILFKNETSNKRQLHSIIFKPELATNDSLKPCTCTSVKRVEIELTAHQRHMMPVDRECCWSHANGITKGFRACEPRDGGPMESQTELWACVQESLCNITDQNLQIATLRDPRAVTVSTYFHLAQRKSPRMANEGIESVDDFFIKYLDVITQWVSLRYFLFTEIIPERSEVFWYEDAVADPIEWHSRYYAFVGLQLPVRAIHYAAAGAIQGGNIFGFHAKGRDYHPGGEEKSPTRTFRNELSTKSLDMMDDVLRKWLPPILLRRMQLVD